ncbi:MAG: hypothetical protein GF333_03620 [Candidatus Omnitrophica bacterium]|nr:hypothetical protein [Candidatus Omnitrophota bacterium]
MTLFLSYSCSPARAQKIGFEKEWERPLELSGYEQLRVHVVDLREIKIRVHDRREAEVYSDALDEETTEKIAYALYRVFSDQLREVLPVQDAAEEKPPEAGTLLLRLSLKGEFHREQQGLLMGFLTRTHPRKGRPAHLHFSCTFMDAASRPIVTLTDSQDFSPRTARPFARNADYEALKKLFGVWARRTRIFLRKERLGGGNGSQPDPAVAPLETLTEENNFQH